MSNDGSTPQGQQAQQQHHYFIQPQLQMHVAHQLHMHPPPHDVHPKSGAGGGCGAPNSAAVQRAALGIRKAQVDPASGRSMVSAASDGQRIWDGRQYRVIKRCPHGKVRKDLCKDCGGAGICEHGNQRYSCKDCGGKSICEHKRARRRCVDCGGKDICQHKQIKHICRECQKDGTGGAGLCAHTKQKQHCGECRGMRLCMHNQQLRLCKHCAVSALWFTFFPYYILIITRLHTCCLFSLLHIKYYMSLQALRRVGALV